MPAHSSDETSRAELYQNYSRHFQVILCILLHFMTNLFNKAACFMSELFLVHAIFMSEVLRFSCDAPMIVGVGRDKRDPRGKTGLLPKAVTLWQWSYDDSESYNSTILRRCACA